MSWRNLALRGRSLCLKHTLFSGQVFQWKECAGGFSGVVTCRPHPPLLVELRQKGSNSLEYRVVCAAGGAGVPDQKKIVSILSKFFQLDVDNGAMLRNEWLKGPTELSAQLRQVQKTAKTQGWTPDGFRVIRQDPEQCLFAFICSQNNNVGRIGLMLDRLSDEYGEPFPVADSEGRRWNTPPTARKLLTVGQDRLTDRLRELGFGYPCVLSV
eukprot:TRINITY_DN15401_c0_g1_i1.p1 TRINITY_DN15401_c0_g1~~TRINITY_DN15401_c0_g1_i1.p1  ORF type:complete len:230 (+),score=48.99 TRINITY_DN15401_c0_g1_i1:57-692(+)